MPVDLKQQPYLLTEAQNQLLFFEHILPDAFDETAPAVKPKAIFLGGQPGSGKSGLSLVVQRTFPETERAVVINSDALREYHPDFSRLQTTNVNQASFLVNPDTRIWQQKLIEAAIVNKRSLVLDGTLGGSPEPIKETAGMLRENGYFVDINVLAVPERLSRFGIYKRYEDQVARRGSGRWVGMENHDRVYKEIPITLIVLENSDHVDCVQVFTRALNSLLSYTIIGSYAQAQALSISGFSILSKNEIARPSPWGNLPAATTLTQGRNRSWTTEEQSAFSVAVETVAEQMRRRGANQEDIANFYRYVECPL